MDHDVFISHSSKDKPIADAICANLEAAGVRCWIAPRDIAPGEDWPRAISNAISQCRIMVLIFSANANSSDQISRELSVAADNNLAIIPFKIENVKPEPGKQYYLGRTHWLDAMNPPTQKQIDLLVERVKSILPKAGTSNLAMVVGGIGSGKKSRVPKTDEVPVHENRTELKLPTRTVITVGIIVLGLGFLAVFFKPLSALPAQLFATSTAVNPSTLVYTLTAIPFTATPIPPLLTTIPPTPTTNPLIEQSSAFTKPILQAIANRKPDFEDDFSTANKGWNWMFGMGGNDGTFVIEQGVARFRIGQADAFMTNKALNKKDFVLQLDARLAAGNKASQMTVNFHLLNSNNWFNITLYSGLREWSVTKTWAGQGISLATGSDNISPISETTQVMIVARGAKYAIYLNNVPIAYFEDADFDTSGNTMLFCTAPSQTVCEFDNVKFWDLSKVTGLP
jgi:hypothetical protein